MLKLYILLSLLLIIYLAYQWGVTAVREYRWGYDDGAKEYAERVKAFAEAHPTLTAEELYQTLKTE